jgi:hypothetical protein
MPDWFVKAISYGVIRWLVGTTVQTGIVVAAVMYFLQISSVSLDSRISDVFTVTQRIETKVDDGFEAVRRDTAENSQTLAGYTEKFISLDVKITSVRNELQTGLNGIGQALSLIDPTAAEPLLNFSNEYDTILVMNNELSLERARVVIARLQAAQVNLPSNAYESETRASASLNEILASLQETAQNTPDSLPDREMLESLARRLNVSLQQRHSGISIGLYSSRFAAEKDLLKTALAEMTILDGSLRQVTEKNNSFEAQFLGLTVSRARAACARLDQRNIQCSIVDAGSIFNN